MRTKDNIAERMGEKLKALREKAGLTRAALADTTGLGRSTIRDYEQGLRKPSLDSAFKLADSLGVKVDVLRECLDGKGT